MSSEGYPPLPPAPPLPPFPPHTSFSSAKAEGENGVNSKNGANESANESANGGATGHHISDVNTWKHPDRNYFVFVILSVLLGLLGADHFYLRSFQTGMLKIAFNIVTLGMWHYWDLIQIVYDGKKIREEGLTSPFDWICGIGKGVFTSAESEAKKPKYVAQKSYLLYAFLAIFFGFLGFDKLYMGQFWQGVAKCLSCFNIFLFLFGFIWVVWDSIHAIFMTKSILEDGIMAPIPYSFFFREPIDGKQFLVNHVFDPKIDGGGFNPFAWLESMIPTLPIPSVSYKGLYSDLVVPFMTPTVVAAINASKSTEPIMKMPEMPDAPTMPGLAQFGLPTALPPLPTALPSMPAVPAVGTPISLLAAPAVNVAPAATVVAPAVNVAPANTAAAPVAAAPVAAALVAATAAAPMKLVGANNSIPNAPPAARPLPPMPEVKTAFAPVQAQRGGGNSSTGPGPAIAGVLTAVILAGGLKGFYDVISKQYG